MNDCPNDFQTVAKSGNQLNPISSYALMQNFVWGKLIVDESLLEDSTAMGFAAKRLKIPPVPQSGTYVLGAISGGLSWIATEECA